MQQTWIQASLSRQMGLFKVLCRRDLHREGTGQRGTGQNSQIMFCPRASQAKTSITSLVVKDNRPSAGTNPSPRLCKVDSHGGRRAHTQDKNW